MRSDLRETLEQIGAQFIETELGPVAIRFDDPALEVTAGKERVALAHCPGIGVYRIGGRDAVDLIQRISTNDLKALEPGKSHQNCFANAKGRIIDQVRIAVDSDALWMFTGPRRGAAVLDWIDRYTITEEIEIEDRTARSLQFELLGPQAEAFVKETFEPTLELREGEHRVVPFAGTDLRVMRTAGLITSPGFLLFVEAEGASSVVTSLLSSGASIPLTPIGQAARDALLIEAGIPRSGHEITEEQNPLEVGLWNSVSFEKGCYVGQEVIARLRTYDKVMRQLVQLRLVGDEDRLAKITEGTKLFDGDKEAGLLTGVAGPPLLDQWHALGFVKKRAIQRGAELQVGAPDAPVRVDRAVPVELR